MWPKDPNPIGIEANVEKQNAISVCHLKLVVNKGANVEKQNATKAANIRP